MKKSLKGVATIEAALIIPLVLLVFIASVHLLFYVHDQNVIGAVVYETAAMGSNRETHNEEELENYFCERVTGRTILFSEVQAEVRMLEKEIQIVCDVQKDWIKIRIERSVKLTDPEGYIRNVRKVKK